jgi:hypothetical protein
MFFSVNNTIKIAGKVYKPCICYKVTNTLELTVNKLVAEGKAELHKDYVYFCNGKIVEKKEVVKENLTTDTGKKAKKGKKEVEEEIPSPEEIADNLDSEGF